MKWRIRRTPCWRPCVLPRSFHPGSIRQTDLTVRFPCFCSHAGRMISLPFEREYENMGAGLASEAAMFPPVPRGPAAAETPPLRQLIHNRERDSSPPTVTFPPRENALTASSELSTMTTSVMSACQLPPTCSQFRDGSPAPICSPHPTPAVAMQDGADQDPSGRRAMTIPDPALPENTNPALRMVNTARPDISSTLYALYLLILHAPLARCNTALGIEFRAVRGCSGLAAVSINRHHNKR
jgi:hypothetical protein